MPVSASRAAVTWLAGEPAPFHVPLFRLLVDDLNDASRHCVFDLGPATTRMLGLLGRSPCRVEIADLADGDDIERLNATSPDAISRISEEILPRRQALADIDVVFCWDLLNYLDPTALSSLMQAVLRRARPDARIHALIYYSERSMPLRPGRFIPTGDGSLVNDVAPGAVRDAPRYSPEDLQRMMGGLSIDGARLLANGMQEFLLLYRG